MPFLVPDVTDENDALATFAGQQLRQMATTMQGLNAEQLQSTPTASALSLHVLALHSVSVVYNVAVWINPDHPVCAADRLPETVDLAEGVDCRRYKDLEKLTAENLISSLERAAEDAEQVLRDAVLSALVVHKPKGPWLKGDERWNNRWCALHLTQEIARHVGHADVIRETIDGGFAYQLNAQFDGTKWPPAHLLIVN